MAKWDKPGTGGGLGNPPGYQPPILESQPQDLPDSPIYATATALAAVRAESNRYYGVWGRSLPGKTPGGGVSDGVRGESGGTGVHGISNSLTDAGVWGENRGFSAGAGMAPGSGGGIGVKGSTTSSEPAKAGVVGINAGAGAGVAAINESAAGVNVPSGFALWASSKATGVYAEGFPAAYFKGDVQVTGDLILINSSADIAEDFDLEDDPVSAEPGTVLIINSSGKLCPSASPYDTRVAGVVSGAGEFRPAVVLQRIESAGRRSPIALLGKTFCKVDASFGTIVGGDLLTTSSTRGHAMKVRDRSQALGAILGKALTSLKSGRGLIPILVSLR